MLKKLAVTAFCLTIAIAGCATSLIDPGETREEAKARYERMCNTVKTREMIPEEVEELWGKASRSCHQAALVNKKGDGYQTSSYEWLIKDGMTWTVDFKQKIRDSQPIGSPISSQVYCWNPFESPTEQIGRIFKGGGSEGQCER